MMLIGRHALRTSRNFVDCQRHSEHDKQNIVSLVVNIRYPTDRDGEGEKEMKGQ